MLLNVEELAKKDRLTYADMADALEYLYKLDYHPVAVKFFWDEAEYNNFQAEKLPGPKMTVCQIALASRMNNFIVKANEDNLMCGNAKTCLGLRAPSDDEVDGHVKYTADWDHAKDCLLAKPMLPLGKLKGFMTAPLAKTPVDPDVVFMVTNVLQAYHIMNDYIGGKKVPTLQFNHTVNSAVCGGMVYCYNEQKPNMNTMCAGSYTSGKTEKGELNVFIPGKDIGILAQQLIRRTAKYGGPSMVGSPGQEWPGLHVCKKCPMVRFKDAE
ncbi:DUF169 domain-containing protein [Desulfoscipio gibsoniae]|uniref:Uncharacterized protein n=1 Tax=Desulfoscipio gibsoniae DSM 7213 TaxID=767817 RepID=R4KME6_9FIRM|nr:DUF169 domain-containing protein [Desulfoscipio gibsoniae]AGL00806.1 hypothetical protein Desgi_1298 [Desulfoscipio gibsoniae DSM 7213]